jgi:hypothetical protein
MAAMRSVLTVAGLALALVACGKKDEAGKASAGAAPAATAAAPAKAPATSPAAMPHRKPGLWEQKVTTSGFSQTTRLCLDAATEAKMSVWGAQTSKDRCQKTSIDRKLDGSWTFASVCDMGSGGKTSTEGAITGDFASSYHLTANSKTEGAQAAQMNGPHAMTMDATWQGPCPAGFKPGDMELPGGMKINIAEAGGPRMAKK